MQQPSRRIYRTPFLATVILLAFVTSARAAGLLLYETGAPDLGTASAGRAAMAADASTAASNPAGMTLLDRSQLLGASGAMLPSSNFDVAPQTTTPEVAAAMPGCSYPSEGSSMYTGSLNGFGSAWLPIPISAELSITEKSGSDVITRRKTQSSRVRSTRQ